MITKNIVFNLKHWYHKCPKQDPLAISTSKVHDFRQFHDADRLLAGLFQSGPHTSPEAGRAGFTQKYVNTK